MSRMLHWLVLWWIGDPELFWHPIGELRFGTDKREAAQQLFADPNPSHKFIAQGAAIVGCMMGSLVAWIQDQPEFSSDQRFIIDAIGSKFFQVVKWSNTKIYVLEIWRYPDLNRRRAKLQLRLRQDGKMVCRLTVRVARL